MNTNTTEQAQPNSYDLSENITTMTHRAEGILNVLSDQFCRDDSTSPTDEANYWTIKQ